MKKYKQVKITRLAILIVLFFSRTIFGYSQVIDEHFPVFNSGEKITYNAVYNWGIIWLNAGTVEFSVSKSKYKNQDAYHFKSFGTSLNSYDWFFKVRDYFQSYSDINSLQPFFFERNTSEGGYNVLDRCFFNYTDSLVYTKIKKTDKVYTEDTVKLRENAFDLLSAVYYTRNIDFGKYKINDKIPVRILLDNEFFDLYIRYLGKEILETHDNRKFKTMKFSVLLIEGTIFKGGEDLFVWVTDDLNRVPVLVDAKILIGSVKATLVSTENLKFPLSSEIK
ncbi:MAG: hypothetical protein A2X13_08480 [Bacteroidetes bacterium GWC2_33_15]|nr:MAG: hypothetical protein A2X10_10310 [Bacteroidetes bacterium GWA2_33_15]OFX51488.1 MAG: hypothetical protein A2X13_08480 [Bacteroidetes bacterium GWC2_33_15]OFX65765.1 MAG: hypothetical protein A2X15_13295 [Bacteroidetes bacterium GWB2_32_14]OFX69516.1 MAG: hypothetical protein A2X14_10060 [Bacteroidetes bacterium GWD2_33_33]